MQTILVVFHLFLAIALIGLILIQHGKGADAGAAFGSGASATVFGARGSASFLTRSTAVLAALFFLSSMTLAYFASKSAEAPGLMDSVVPAEQEVAPVAPLSEVPPAAPSAVPSVPETSQPESAAGSAVPQVPATEEVDKGAATIPVEAESKVEKKNSN
ncbi:MAG TPA: preprotein translocase subunit SecG [Chromatiales bacterium]|nr:preprotein translocase subunit SecG [Chromatiales bacterium]